MTIDLELLKRIGERDSKAFETLYGRYNKAFLTWVYSKLNDWDEAADMMQNFWTEIWLKSNEIRTDENHSARAFLSRRLYFMVMRYFHAQVARKEIFSDPLVEKYMDSLSYTHVEEDLSVKEIQAIIDEVLKKMPLVTQRIYELRMIENLSVKETAAAVHLKEGTVRNHLSEAMSVLRNELSRYASSSDAEKGVRIILLMLLMGRL